MSKMRHISEPPIPGYKKPIMLRRDAIPRARGMALYIKNRFSASHNACFECGCHAMLAPLRDGDRGCYNHLLDHKRATQTPRVNHNNFYLCSICHNLDLDNSIFDCLLMTMATIQESDVKASFVFIGDFNVHHKEWLNSVSPTDGHGLRALEFSLNQVVSKSYSNQHIGLVIA